MSSEIEAAGALVTAGLAAHEIETARDGAGTPPKNDAGPAHEHGSCRNCGAALRGAYCHACGQAAHIHRSLLHLAEEVLHGVLHFDAKGWRTLPLLVARPGLLTRRYVDGQRVRYVSPLALFLFTVFLMFFAASLANHPTKVYTNPAEALVELRKAVDEARQAEAKAQAGLARAKARGEDVADAQAELADAQAEVASAQSAVAAVEIAAGAAQAANAAASGASAAE
ncbi:MAG TPA: DUF3667 domain-containing protein, partial [Burkholderiaceae bacterium]|nr:DUF3667 domain-containing protein [Burkholderiaceae bacterium]